MGTFSSKRYYSAILVTDHHIDLSFVYFIKQSSTDAILNRKYAFERISQQYRISIKHYCTDNLYFDLVESKEYCQTLGQGIYILPLEPTKKYQDGREK